MRKKFKKIGSNAIDPATTSNKNWFKPIPGKGGKTTSFDAEMPSKEMRKKIYGKGE